MPVSDVEGVVLPGDEEQTAPPGRRRPSAVTVLSVALTLAVLVAAALALRLYRGEQLDVGRAGARDVVARYTAALDRHDLGAVHAVSVDQASFAESESLTWPMVGPLTRDDRDAFFTRLFAAGLRLQSSGPAQVAGDGPYYRVTVHQSVQYSVAGIAVEEDAISLFTVVDGPDGPRITEHVWWRPLREPKPSMAWVVWERSRPDHGKVAQSLRT